MGQETMPLVRGRPLAATEEDEEDPTQPSRQPYQYFPRKSSGEKGQESKRQEFHKRKESEECQAMLAFGERQGVMVDLGDKHNIERDLSKSRHQTKAEIRRKRGQDEDDSNTQQGHAEPTILSYLSASSNIPITRSAEADDIPQAPSNGNLKETTIVSRDNTSGTASTFNNQAHTASSHTSKPHPSTVTTVTKH